jgi:hypothetical protein
MVLAKIQDSIVAYKKWLQTVQHHPRLYLWESLQNFQTNWNPDDPDPVGMFDRSFYNTDTRRLWQTEGWYPKKMMLEFWQMDPGSVRLLFDDLFNATKEEEGRVRRFIFGCDELLVDYKQKNITTIENNHYHGDYRMIGLYLAFRYPESYALYDFAIFQKALIHLGGRDIPMRHDIGRFFKVMRTLMNFLDKDEPLKRSIAGRLDPKRHYTGKTLLLATDFCYFITKS